MAKKKKKTTTDAVKILYKIYGNTEKYREEVALLDVMCPILTAASIIKGESDFVSCDSDCAWYQTRMGCTLYSLVNIGNNYKG